MKKLYRSKTDRKIAGVCGGLGESFGMDPLIFRIAFVFISIAFFFGVVLYLLLWVLAPEGPASS